jgi:molybdopterin synthase catalytic subunit
METQLNSDDILLISDKPINAEEVISSIKWDECGALVTFIGKVRGDSEGQRVLSLEHDATEYGAEKMLQTIAREMRGKWDLGSIAFSYRTGPVAAGEITLVIAVGAVHRQEAFAACQYAIDQFKQNVSAKEIRENV